VIFPVRFSYFDAGHVESFFAPLLSSPAPPHLIVTLSLEPGDHEHLWVEEWAGRNRDPRADDNLGDLGGSTTATASVVPPPGLGPGSQFLRTSLPVPEMTSSPIPANSRLQLIHRGDFRARRGRRVVDERTRPPVDPSRLRGYTAETGSGENFLSNEIFYRTRRIEPAGFPGGHIHVPEPRSAGERADIIEEVRNMITSALPRL
jgi:hypothetical protein